MSRDRITLLDKWKVLQTIVADLTVGNCGKVVAARLLQFLNNETGRCDPSYGTIASEVGMKRATVIAAVKNLESAQWVAVNRSKTGFDRESGRPETNQFEFNFARSLSGARKRGPSAPKQTHPSAEKGTPPSHENGTNPVPENGPTQCPKTDSPSPENGTLNTSREIHQGNTSIEKGESETLPPRENLFPEDDAKKQNPSRGKNTSRGKSSTPQEPDERFDEFWRHYPKKVKKPDAIRAWQAALKRGADPLEIIRGAMAYAAERDREPDPHKRFKFTSHPASWLSDESWADERAPAPSQADRTVSQANGRPRRMSAVEQVMAMQKARGNV